MKIDWAVLLTHPLTIVIVGGFVAALVGQYVTSVWQSQRTALELKNELIKEMSEAIYNLLSIANKAEVHRTSIPEDETRERLVNPIQEFTVFSEVFKTRLKVHYPDTDLHEDWFKIFEAAYTFTHLAGTFSSKARADHLRKLDSLLDLEHSEEYIDIELLADRASVDSQKVDAAFSNSWRRTKNLIEQEKDALALKILENSIKGELSGGIFGIILGS